MAQELIISISGMRGIIGQNLTPEIASLYAATFGTFLKKKFADKEKLKVCIGRDSRPSGLMVASAITSGLCATGIDVVDVGIISTPGAGVMLRELKCDGGIVITASHNPIEYNGIKLVLGNGVAPPVEDAVKIRQMYFDKDIQLVPSIDCGKVTHNTDAIKVHIDKVLPLVDADAIKSKKYKVVVDSVNGAGGPEAKMILDKLGCETVFENFEPNGIFAHTPEPTKDNLTDLCDKVKEHSGDIGFAQDPDADRLAIVDENGTYIGEEYTLVLASKYVISKLRCNAAANLSTSRMIDDVAAEYGVDVFRTPVGEANVADAMFKNDCIIGGEGNGGVIDLRVGPIRDSILGIALVLQLMAETGKTVSELVSEQKAYYMSKEKFPCDDQKFDAIVEGLKKQYPDAKVDDSDGYRFDLPDSWIHLRKSNTEPVVRLIVEAANEDDAKSCVNFVANLK